MAGAEKSWFGDVPNVRRFIWFRIFFGARFYYPVFAVMFLDFGLTLSDFAILNAVWAAAIVCLEVPSGALADLIGRKRLIVIACVLMLVEMLVLAFVPLGDHTIVFWAFLANRVLSGAAEACASGADEALAYDSLAAVDRQREWPKVLDLQMRGQAIAMMIAMVVGAAVYDAGLIHKLTSISLSPQVSLRFPIYLTALSALAGLITVIRFEESHTHSAAHETTQQILRAGRWIIGTPLALVLIVVGLSFDSVTRLFLTLDSRYFRLIGLPDGSFGLINAGLALVGFVAPMLSRKLVENRSRIFNFWVVSGMIEVGLIGIALTRNWSGLIWVVPAVMGFYMLGFFTSHYLNEITESRMRATVLSFRGMAQNLAYGAINIAFAGLMVGLRKIDGSNDPFADALLWLPGYLLVLTIALAVWGRLRLGKSTATV